MINIKGVVKRAVRETTTNAMLITKLNASEANSARLKTPLIQKFHAQIASATAQSANLTLVDVVLTGTPYSAIGLIVSRARKRRSRNIPNKTVQDNQEGDKYPRSRVER